MRSPQRPFEVLCHPGKRQIERRAPSDKHVIMSGAKPVCGREPNNFPQAAADPITLNRISDLL